MVALTGMGRRLHFAQQGIHFIRLHPPARADRAMARDARQDRIQPVRDAGGGALVRQLITNIGQQRLTIHLTQRGRHRLDRNSSRAKRLQLQPDEGKGFRRLHQTGEVIGR